MMLQVTCSSVQRKSREASVVKDLAGGGSPGPCKVVCCWLLGDTVSRQANSAISVELMKPSYADRHLQDALFPLGARRKDPSSFYFTLALQAPFSEYHCANSDKVLVCIPEL